MTTIEDDFEFAIDLDLSLPSMLKDLVSLVRQEGILPVAKEAASIALDEATRAYPTMVGGSRMVISAVSKYIGAQLEYQEMRYAQARENRD